MLCERDCEFCEQAQECTMPAAVEWRDQDKPEKCDCQLSPDLAALCRLEDEIRELRRQVTKTTRTVEQLMSAVVRIAEGIE